MFRFNRGRLNQREVEQLLLEIKEFQSFKKELLHGVHPEQNQILHFVQNDKRRRVQHDNKVILNASEESNLSFVLILFNPVNPVEKKSI